MPQRLRFEYDDFEGGYYRSGVPILKNYIQPVMSGRVIAHDYVEHPLGYPTGTLEDEIAAFGVIIATRFQAGMVGNSFLAAPDEMLAIEIREMLNLYREGVPPNEQLKPRRKYWGSNVYFMEDIVELISSEKVIQDRLLGWFHHGVTRCRQRFKHDHRVLDLFCNIESCVDDFLKVEEPFMFELIINGTQVRIREVSHEN